MTALVLARRTLAAIAGAASVVALTVAGAPTADAATGAVSTGGDTLTLRAGTSSSTTALANIPHGTSLNLICKMPGQSIAGTQGTTTWWDRVSYGGKVGYVSAAYVSGGLNTSVCGVVNTGGDTLTLRSSASTSGTALANIPHGTLLPLQCKKSGSSVTGTYGTTTVWDKVTYGGQTGYISAAYTRNGTSSAIPSCPTTVVTGVVNTGGATLTMRSLASSSGSALANIPHGTTLTLQCKASGQSIAGTYGTTSTWNKVSYGGQTGWVSAAYVSNGNSSALPTCVAPQPPSGSLVNPYGASWGPNGGWTPRAAWMRDTIKARFGMTCTTYATSSGEHSNGNALDCWGTSAQMYDLSRWVAANARSTQTWYVIYAQRIWNLSNPSAGWVWMADRGSPTQNHYDHVHISMQTPSTDYLS